jgi:predicted nucleic acid-binding protein
MHKVLIDTNVWVDIILNRPDYADCSKGAVLACIENDIEMLIAATSIKDVFYFAEQSAGSDAAYRALDYLFELATPATVDELICKRAVELERPDYEDGIVAACAETEQAEAVITRDGKSFIDASFEKHTPAEFLAKLGYERIEL